MSAAHKPTETHAPILFDTLQYHKKLVTAGLTDKQAEAITNANLDAFTQMLEVKELATKKDLQNTENKIYGALIKTAITIIGVLSSLQGALHFFN